MKFMLLIVSVLAATRLAAADDGVTRGYLAAGGTVGVEHVGYLGANLDGGVRIAQTPVFAHAQLSTGVASTGLMTDGRYSSFRAGPEGRWCVHQTTCLSGGVDVGVRNVRIEFTDDFGDTSVDEDGNYLLVVPRLGFEYGKRIQLRANVEAPTAVRSGETLTGLGVSLGAGFAF